MGSRSTGPRPGLIAQDDLWSRRRRIKTQRETAEERRLWRRARNAEASYARNLRQVARQIGMFVRGQFNPDDPNNPGWQSIIDALMQHADLLKDWASAAGNKMLADVDRRDRSVWIDHGKQIGRALREELANAPIGEHYNTLLQNQTEQIANISVSAAERIAKLRDRTMDMVTTGERWNDIVKDVMEQEDVSRGHANTIARTEVSRAQSTFTAARATTIGSTHFRWATASDADVRPLHRGFAGNVYPWDDPPILDDGRPGLPGTIWNCRCHPVPILPDEPHEMQKPARSPEYIASLKPEAAPINKAYREGKLTYSQYVEKLLSL